MTAFFKGFELCRKTAGRRDGQLLLIKWDWKGASEVYCTGLDEILRTMENGNVNHGLAREQPQIFARGSGYSRTRSTVVEELGPIVMTISCCGSQNMVEEACGTLVPVQGQERYCR
jgi:hypothetical protein